MRKLTEEKIKLLMQQAQPKKGVDAVTREMLEALDLDELPTIVQHFRTMGGDHAVLMSNGSAFSLDRFTPRAGSIYFKPSFAGRQVLIGINDSDLPFYSNGVWFSTSGPRDDSEAS